MCEYHEYDKSDTTTKCRQCGKEFRHLYIIDGEKKSLRGRKLCLACSPYKFRRVLTCKRCGKDFPLRQERDGKSVAIGRKHCLECVPWGQTVHKLYPAKIDRDRICSMCGKEYFYDRKKGHKAKRCNSCCKVAAHIAKKKGAVEYKGGKCERCGYNKYYGALHFHHLDPSAKEFNFKWSRRWEVLKKEIDKCSLLCANCHAEVHDEERRKEHLNGSPKVVRQRKRRSRTNRK